ncbi:19494_t:CDS:2, partial [Gigaspora margarita]
MYLPLCQQKFNCWNIPANINKATKDIVKSPPKKSQYTITSAYFFFPGVNVPLQADESLDILKMFKLAVCTFDQNTTMLGLTCSYIFTKLETKNTKLKQIIQEIVNLRIKNTRLKQIIKQNQTTNDALQIPIISHINSYSDETSSTNSLNLEQ